MGGKIPAKAFSPVEPVFQEYRKMKNEGIKISATRKEYPVFIFFTGNKGYTSFATDKKRIFRGC